MFYLTNSPQEQKLKETDPSNRFKIRNMTGKFKKNKKGETIKRTCKSCNQIFDNHIVRWPDSKSHLFECPSCIILKNDPLNEVIQVLYEPSILKSNFTYNYNLKLSEYQAINTDPRVGIEIRTLKLDGEHFYDQTWPDKCCIRLNGKIVKEIEPLNQNSSLKKRRDQKYFMRHHIKMGLNTINITFKNVRDGKNTKCDFDPNYVFTVVLIKKNSVEELNDAILKNCVMSEEESKNFIKNRFMKENSQKNDLLISEIKVDLLCKITFTYVKNPTRGEFCTHLDCFSLDYFLKSMEQNLVRKWICPLCRKRCINLKVDKYFEKVIEEAKEKGDMDINKVFFKSDGSYSLRLDEFEEENPPVFETQLNDEGNIQENNNFESNPLEILSITSEEDINEKTMEFEEYGDELIKPEVLLQGNYSSKTMLKKRPFEAIETKRIKMDKNFRKDEAFLLNLWKHHESQKHNINKNLQINSLEEFKGKFLELCEKDIFFSKKIALLYKFVLIRRRENENSIVMRYNKILDEVNGQPNWIYGYDNENESYFRQNKMLKHGNFEGNFGNKRDSSDKEKEDTMLLRSLVDDYNLEFDEEMSDTVEGFKNGGESSKMAIEII